MAVSLRKNERISLVKGLKEVVIGLGWVANVQPNAPDLDLDASCFLLGANGKVPTDDDFVFYGNLHHLSGAVNHTGDDRVGGKEGDCEVIEVDLSKIPENIRRLVFTVTIYDADKRWQNMGMARNAYVRLARKGSNTDELRYDLTEDYGAYDAVVVCEIYRDGADWKFAALGEGTAGGLYGLCKRYGVNV